MDEHVEQLLYELGSAVNEGPLGAPRVAEALSALESAGQQVTMLFDGRRVLVVREI